MTAPTLFEQSLLALTPACLLRCSDEGLLQIAGNPMAVSVLHRPSIGTKLVPADGVFGMPAARFTGARDNYGRVANRTDINPTTALSFVVVMGKVRNPNPTAPDFVTVSGCTEGGGYSFAVYPDGRMYFYVRAGAAYLTLSFDRNLLQASGNVVLGTYDGRYARLYLNGNQVDIGDAGSIKAISYGGIDLLIGCDPGSNNAPSTFSFADVDIAYVGVFGYALSVGQSAAVWTAYMNAKKLAGTALLDDGSAATKVIINDWLVDRVAAVSPQSGGGWAADVPAGDYLITAVGPSGYRPISHGPVTAVDP